METYKSETQNEVLFQKIGGKWYIFSEQKGEVVYSAMPNGMDPRTTKLELYRVIEDHIKRVAKNMRSTEAAA